MSAAMKKLVWLLTTIGFVAPLGVRIVQQMHHEMVVEHALSMVQDMLLRVHAPWYVLATSIWFGLAAGTKRGRRTSWKLSRGVLSLAFQFLYLNTRARLGRFMAFLWCFGWVGIALTGWQALWGSWAGLVMMVGYWGGLLCAFYLQNRYAKWQFLKFRLPGRVRWSGIGEELHAAGGRLARFYRRDGHSRR
jgi:hypothetical protein